jgi:hypothetical protein
MADTIAVLWLRPGDEGIGRNLHVAGCLGNRHDPLVAVLRHGVVGIDDASVNLLLKRLERTWRNAVSGKKTKGFCVIK